MRAKCTKLVHRTQGTNRVTCTLPELTPLDFLLCGTVKDVMYRRKLRNPDTLWDEIQTVCAEIPLDTLLRSTESVVTRTQKCIDVIGQHPV